MRLHTNTHTWRSIHEALAKAIRSGMVADHVELWICDEYGSRSKSRAFEIRLGTSVKIKGDKRTFLNSGTHGADTSMYAATYDEWGWFIAELFAVEPDATFGTYIGGDGFNAATKNAYLLDQQMVTQYPQAG